MDSTGSAQHTKTRSYKIHNETLCVIKGYEQF